METGLLGKFILAVEFIYKQSPIFCQKMTTQKKNLFPYSELLIKDVKGNLTKVILTKNARRK